MNFQFLAFKKATIEALKVLNGLKSLVENLMTTQAKCRLPLNDAGIFLHSPPENSEPVLTFNISVLMELEEYDRQHLLLQDQVRTIMSKNTSLRTNRQASGTVK